MPAPPLERLFHDYLTTGDEDALAQWMRRSGPPLRRLGLRLGASADDVDDLVQETFVAAIQGADRYDQARPMLPWLKGILTFRAARLARDDVRRRHHYQASTQGAATWTAQPDHEHAELDRDVRQAIDDLPPQYREPLAQYLLAQRSPIEIAERLGVKRTTVRVRLHRGMQRLRDSLRRWGALALAVLLGRRATAQASVRVAAVLLAMASLVWWSLAEQPDRAARAPTGSVAPRATQPDQTPDRTPGSRDEIDRRTAAPRQPTSPLGSLTILVRQRSGAPLANVGIAVEPASGRDPVLHRRTAVTDDDGTASFDDLENGTWRLASDRGQSAMLDITSGKQRHELLAPAGRSVHGLVTDTAGTPVAGAAVWLSRGLDGPWRGCDVTRSGPDGRFALDQVPEGCFLAARHPSLARSEPVQLQAGDRTITLRLSPPGGRARVLVRDRADRLVADAAIFVGDAMDASPLWLAQGAAPWRAPPFAGRTDARGTFQTAALEPGVHPVFVRHEGSAPYRALVRVEPHRTVEHVVRLEPGARVTGIVLDRSGLPVGSALVVFRHNDSSASIDSCTRPDGTFDFECLPTGSGELLSKASGYAIGRTHVELTPTSQHCRITLAATRTITGHVLLGGQLPPAGSMLQACWPPSAIRDDRVTTAIGDGGTLRIENAHPTRPRLRIRLGCEPIWRSVDESAAWTENDVTIRLPSDFAATGWLEGRCLSDDGTAIQNAHVHASCDGRWSEVGRTDANGYYRVGPLAPATYRVFAESTRGDQPTVVSEALPVAAGTVRRVDLTASGTGTAAIELARADGKPLRDVLSTIHRVDLHRRFAISNRARFEQRLEAGDYVLAVMGSSVQWVDEHRFTIRPGATTPVALTLEPAHRCSMILSGFPDRAPDAPTTIVLRSLRDEAFRPTFTLLPDAPLRVGAVLAPGSYWLEHTATDGSRWRGDFAIASAREALAPIVVTMHRAAVEVR